MRSGGGGGGGANWLERDFSFPGLIITQFRSVSEVERRLYIGKSVSYAWDALYPLCLAGFGIPAFAVDVSGHQGACAER